MNLNQVQIGGNIVRDPDSKFLQNGTAVCEFTIAINRKRKRQDGQVAEEAAFIGCVAFGKQAEVIAAHFVKGNRICCVGRLAQDSWEDKKTGEKKSKTKVIVENFHFVDRAGDRAIEAPSQGSQQSAPQPTKGGDVPF